jgi:hypothetical protein
MPPEVAGGILGVNVTLDRIAPSTAPWGLDVVGCAQSLPGKAPRRRLGDSWGETNPDGPSL